MARVVPPEVTLERIRPLLGAVGITRVATLTGLDRLGIPVVAVMRPNSRSYAVAQGKGLTLEAAKVSGLMESIENFHAEELCLPLRRGSVRELRQRFALPQMAGLPRLSTSVFNDQHAMLWVEGARDLTTDEPVLLPFELVHLDFRLPRPEGSGCFLSSSNGLASGNHILEALSHALCEVIERDANSLWHCAPESARERRRLDLKTVTDPACRALLDRLDCADVDVLAWDTTTDIRIASALCTLVDRDSDVVRPMPAVRGSGCHPMRSIALSRALTEAAQGRLTRISGSRDDLANPMFDDEAARRSASANRLLLSRPAVRDFGEMGNVEHATVADDVETITHALRAAGLHHIYAMDLTRPDFDVPVVKVVVPFLEAGSEFPGYVWGRRARRALEAAV